MTRLLIKNCRMINPKTEVEQYTDILINNGVIEAIKKDIEIEADEIFDASHLIATPGLMDIHSHIAPSLIPICVNPDNAGIETGVTALCDAGSLGWKNYEEGRSLIEKHYKTDVFHFLHLAPEGQVQLPETGYDELDIDAINRLINQNKDQIVGIKVRAVESSILFRQYDIFKIAAEIAHSNRIPLMIHLGDHNHKVLTSDELYQATSNILEYLKAGDILTHAFTSAPGGIIKDGKPIPRAKEAICKGVLLDMSPGLGHMSFNVLQSAICQGIKPNLFGTDVVLLDSSKEFLKPHFYSVSVIASKLMAIGLNLHEVIRMATVNVAMAINKSSEYGSIEVGRKADITLLKIIEGRSMFHDGGCGNVIHGNKLLSPQWVIKSGELYKVNKEFSNHRVDPMIFQALMERQGGKKNG